MKAYETSNNNTSLCFPPGTLVPICYGSCHCHECLYRTRATRARERHVSLMRHILCFHRPGLQIVPWRPSGMPSIYQLCLLGPPIKPGRGHLQVTFFVVFVFSRVPLDFARPIIRTSSSISVPSHPASYTLSVCPSIPPRYLPC